MKISFDPWKAHLNEIKHGVSLSFAERIDWSEVMAMPDVREDYVKQT